MNVTPGAVRRHARPRRTPQRHLSSPPAERARWRRFLPLCLALAIGGCATIMQGSSEQISVASTPTGAQVFVDGREAGITPMIANLSRKDRHVLSIRMDGYRPYELPIARSVSGWVAGNLVFGGVPGLIVDAVTGGMYKLTPTQVTATLGEGAATLGRDDGAIVVAVVLGADPAWQKVGQLERE